MRKLELLVTGVALIVGVARAAGAQSPDKTPVVDDAWLQRVLDGITLTSQQHTRLDSLAKQMWLKLEAQQPLMVAAPDSIKRKTMRALRTQEAADVERILGRDQTTLFRKNFDAWKKAFDERQRR